MVVLGGLAMSAVAALFLGVTTSLLLLVPLMIVQGLAQATGFVGDSVPEGARRHRGQRRSPGPMAWGLKISTVERVTRIELAL